MHAPVPGGSPEAVLPEFVRGLHDLVREHRELFAAMTFGHLVGTRAKPALDRLESMGAVIARTHGLRFDSAVAVRIATAAVVAVALVEDELFPPESGIGSDRVVQEMVRMLIGAARYEPPATG